MTRNVLNSLVAAKYGEALVIGRVVAVLGSNCVLVMRPDGSMRSIYYTDVFLPGEATVWGEVVWDPDQTELDTLREATTKLVTRASVQAAVNAVVRAVERDVNRDRVRDLTYDIPLTLVVKQGGYYTLSPRLMRYLMRPQEERDREAAALRLMQSGKAGRGSERQYQVLMACYYGGLPQAWVANSWGVSRAAVHHIYQRALNFLAGTMGSEEIAPLHTQDTP